MWRAIVVSSTGSLNSGSSWPAGVRRATAWAAATKVFDIQCRGAVPTEGAEQSRQDQRTELERVVGNRQCPI